MPRRRVFQHLDFATGEVTERTEIVEQDASLEERFQELAEAHAEMGPPSFYAVVCDGCGLRVEVSGPVLPADWITTPEGEFCPACCASMN